jgi:hypothetical protein
MKPDYMAVCMSKLYGGDWVVIRMKDNKVMLTTPSPFAAARWIQVWGPMRLTDDKGSLASHRIVEVAESFLPS